MLYIRNIHTHSIRTLSYYHSILFYSHHNSKGHVTFLIRFFFTSGLYDTYISSRKRSLDDRNRSIIYYEKDNTGRCWLFILFFLLFYKTYVVGTQKNRLDETVLLSTQNPCCLFVCFVALRPKSTAMVIAGWSVHLTTLFPGQA